MTTVMPRLPLPPLVPAHRLTDAQRATEAAQILARGVMRWHQQRRGRDLDDAEEDTGFRLDFLPTESVHADRYHSPEYGA